MSISWTNYSYSMNFANNNNHNESNSKHNLFIFVASLVLATIGILYTKTYPSFTSPIIISITIITIICTLCYLKNDNKDNRSIASNVVTSIVPPARLPSFLQPWCNGISPPPPAKSVDLSNLNEEFIIPAEVIKEVVTCDEDKTLHQKPQSEYDYDLDSDSDYDEPSMEETWKAISAGRAGQKETNAFEKSKTWERTHRDAQDYDIAEMKRSKTTEKKVEDNTRWRKRDLDIMPADQLKDRAEMMIKEHRRNLRSQPK